MGIRIGVDLGGTKIEIIAIDETGATLVRRRTATPVNDYAATLGAIVTLIGGVEREVGRAHGVGIGTPGALSRESRLIKNSNSTVLIGEPLADDLEATLGRPIRLENDANCFALSEATDGAGAHAQVVFGVILGTGAGAGIAIDGRIIGGANAIAGEWGHNPLPWPREDELPGPRCYCGRDGCLETFLCGPAFARDYRTASATDLAPHAIVLAARSGDEHARGSLARYCDRLARGLATVINILDPDTIVLGGGMSNIDDLAPSVLALLPRYVFSDRVDTAVVRAVHGDSSGVRGAAMLWPAS